jgi:outer membrane protein assembly factor BamB
VLPRPGTNFLLQKPTGLASLLAIDSTGQISWTASVPVSSNNGGVTTTTTPGAVYALSSGYNMIVTAFDAGTGKTLWKSSDNTTLDQQCIQGGGFINWGLKSDDSTVLFYCGPNIVAWDTEGNSLWSHFTIDPQFGGIMLTPFQTLIYNSINSCSYKLSNFQLEWCIQPEGQLSAISPKDGSMIGFVMEYFQQGVIGYTLVSYTGDGKYQWTFPVTANYTGFFVELYPPIFGDGQWYWMTGQPGVLYVFESDLGKIVGEVSGLDPNLNVEYVDDNGVVYAQGKDYLCTIVITNQ